MTNEYSQSHMIYFFNYFFFPSPKDKSKGVDCMFVTYPPYIISIQTSTSS